MAIEWWIARSSAANRAAPSARAAQPHLRGPVMMEQSLHGEFRLASLNHRHNESGGAVRLSGTVRASSLRTFEPVGLHGSPLWASPDVPLKERAPRRAETKQIPLLRGIRRIVAAIRLWRERARSRQELRALDDRLLKDIGVRREGLGYEFPQLFWHWD